MRSKGFPLRCAERAFRAVAVGVIPEAVDLGEAEWQEMYAIITRALSARPGAITRQLSLFVTVLGGFARVRHGRSLERLTQPARERFLHSIETAPIPILRKGMWGLRTLILMGYYARPAAGRALGYQGNRAGWARLQSQTP